MSRELLLRKNERFCREQAEISLGAKDKWLKLAEEWAALAEQVKQQASAPIDVQNAPTEDLHSKKEPPNVDGFDG
jgi:hypothetical protein